MSKYVRDKSHSKFDLLNNIYPIGSIYMSINETNPSSLFGGTWEQIKDTFLLSAGDTYEAGSIGGEAEHALTIEEIPAHAHMQVGAQANESGPYPNIPLLGRSYSATGIDIDTNKTGGEQAHNNMPPYLTVYMWKRVA